MKKLLLVLTLFFIVGCDQEFDDISSSEEYSHLIGKTYHLIVPLRIHEITLERNYKGITSHYALTKMPGMSGPEVIASNEVHVGTVIKIKKVLECSNCWIGSPKVIVIDLGVRKLKKDVPVYLYGLIKNVPNDNVIVDPDYLFDVNG